MKKRKPPYVLVSIFLVLIAAAFVMSNRMLNVTNPGLTMHDHEHADEQAPPPQETASTLAQGVGGKVPPSGAAGAVGADRPELPEDPNQKPSIVRPKVVIPKPQPNDSRTAGQWYVGDGN